MVARHREKLEQKKRHSSNGNPEPGSTEDAGDTGIETLIREVLPVQQIGGFAPSTLLVGSLYIGLTAQSFDIGLLDWIRPLCARADKGSMIVWLPAHPQCGSLMAHRMSERV